jgi:hypothetical protein
MASVDAMLAKLQKSSKGLLAEMTEAIPSNFKVFASFLLFYTQHKPLVSPHYFCFSPNPHAKSGLNVLLRVDIPAASLNPQMESLLKYLCQNATFHHTKLYSDISKLYHFVHVYIETISFFCTICK